LQFSPTLIGQTSTVESIAKTLVLTLPAEDEIHR
jgi:hypothetical protein